MKTTAQQLIENELQKTVQQIKEHFLSEKEKQELVDYKKELEQLLFLKNLSDTYHLERKNIEKLIVLPAPSTNFANFRIVDDTEIEERKYWQELQIEGEKLFLNQGDILIKKR